MAFVSAGRRSGGTCVGDGKVHVELEAAGVGSCLCLLFGRHESETAAEDGEVNYCEGGRRLLWVL